MKESRTKRVLTIFLASPGDLDEERRAARTVVDELNRIFRGTLDWQIDLLGWEDALPGAARPQKIINEAVDKCDLFIGMLWRRWGQPTGEYSSGFQEEYTRACERRKSSDNPEIWLLFRKVDAEFIDDAGEQLRAVLAFKQARIRAKDHFFKEFAEPDEFARSLREWLNRYVLQIERSTTEERAPTKSSPGPNVVCTAPDKTMPVGDGVASEDARQAVLEVLRQTTGAVADSDLSVFPRGTPVLPTTTLARLHLASLSWLSTRETSERLGAHAINLAYHLLEDISLTPSEALLIVRSLVADSAGILPGWRWLQKLDPGALMGNLRTLACSDGDASVREEAVNLRACADPELADGTGWLLRVLQDPEPGVRQAGLRYLATAGHSGNIAAVERCTTDNDVLVQHEAQVALVALLAKDSATAAFRHLMTETTIEPPPTTLLSQLVRSADNSALLLILA